MDESVQPIIYSQPSLSSPSSFWKIVAGIFVVFFLIIGVVIFFLARSGSDTPNSSGNETGVFKTGGSSQISENFSKMTPQILIDPTIDNLSFLVSNLLLENNASGQILTFTVQRVSSDTLHVRTFLISLKDVQEQFITVQKDAQFGGIFNSTAQTVSLYVPYTQGFLNFGKIVSITVQPIITLSDGREVHGKISEPILVDSK